MRDEESQAIDYWEAKEPAFKPGEHIGGIGTLIRRGWSNGVSVWWLKDGGCISVPNLIGWLAARHGLPESIN